MRFAICPKTLRPGCPLIQALYGGNTSEVSAIFSSELWILEPVSMVVVDLPRKKWVKLANMSQPEILSLVEQLEGMGA